MFEWSENHTIIVNLFFFFFLGEKLNRKRKVPWLVKWARCRALWYICAHLHEALAWCYLSHGGPMLEFKNHLLHWNFNSLWVLSIRSIWVWMANNSRLFFSYFFCLLRLLLLLLLLLCATGSKSKTWAQKRKGDGKTKSIKIICERLGDSSNILYLFIFFGGVG